MPIELTRRFVRQYSRLPALIQRKVDKALLLLDADFRHPGLRSHPIDSAPGIFEAYIDRKYRMPSSGEAISSLCATLTTTMNV